MVWLLAYVLEKHAVKTTKLLKYQVEQMKHFVVFFLLIAIVVGHCFPAKQKIKQFYVHALYRKIKNGISTSVLHIVQFPVYLAEKQAIKGRRVLKFQTCWLSKYKSVTYWLAFTCYIQTDKPVSNLF